jgi:hypothetical protein
MVGAAPHHGTTVVQRAAPQQTAKSVRRALHRRLPSQVHAPDHVACRLFNRDRSQHSAPVSARDR